MTSAVALKTGRVLDGAVPILFGHICLCRADFTLLAEVGLHAPKHALHRRVNVVDLKLGVGRHELGRVLQLLGRRRERKEKYMMRHNAHAIIFEKGALKMKREDSHRQYQIHSKGDGKRK